MADFFREVDEEVRRDKALAFWERYQTKFIALALVVVAAAGGWRYVDNHRRAAAEAAGARYEEALGLARAGKSADADQAFQDVIRLGNAGFSDLARFRAAAQAALTDRAKGVSIYDALAGDGSLAPLMQDTARIRAALLRLDDAPAEEMRARLEPMTAPDKPYRNTARELLAYAALKIDDYDAMGRWLDAILVDLQAPPATRDRAASLIGLVTAQQKPK